MAQDPCKNERQAMENAQTNLLKVAKRILMASNKPVTMPDELEEAINQFRIANQNYEIALRAQFEDEDWKAISGVTQIY